MNIEKKAFPSEMCHSHDWNSPNRDPPFSHPFRAAYAHIYIYIYVIYIIYITYI